MRFAEAGTAVYKQRIVSAPGDWLTATQLAWASRLQGPTTKLSNV